MAPHRARQRGAGALLLLAAAGCAGDDLAARPDPGPGAGTWLVVWLAAVAATAALAAVVTWPVWWRGRGSRLATAVLGVQAAAAWVAGAVAFGAAVRTRQLSARELDELPVESLLELGRIGGERFLGMLELTVLIFVGLPAVALTVAARFAGSARLAERVAASIVLAAQIGIWIVVLLRALLVDDPGATVWIAGLNLPVALLALAACWPGREGRPMG